MPPIKVRATEEGHYNGRIQPEGKEFILVDRILPAIAKGPHKRKETVLTAEKQFSEVWMERVAGATQQELVRAQRIAELEALTTSEDASPLPGQGAQGGLMAAPKKQSAAERLADQELAPKAGESHTAGAAPSPLAPVAPKAAAPKAAPVAVESPLAVAAPQKAL